MAFILATLRKWFFTVQHLGVLLYVKEIHAYPFLEVLQILTTGPVTTATNENVRLVLRDI